MPAKGARDGAIVDGLLRFADARFDSRDLCSSRARSWRCRLSALMVRECRALPGSARRPFEVGRARCKFDLGVFELDFKDRRWRLARHRDRLWRSQERGWASESSRVARSWPSVDVRAFIEKDTGDAAGDFGGDGGAPARGDIAAGVQESLAADRIACCGCSEDRCGLSQRKGISEHHDAGQEKDGDGGEDDPITRTALPAVALGYMQGAEIMLWGIRWCRHSRRVLLVFR